METEKLYSPLNFYIRDKEEAAEGQYDDIDYWRDSLTHEEAFQYMDAIELAIRRDRDWMDSEGGLAEYVPNSLDDIVVSFFPNIELHGDRLWCVADITLTRPVTPGEMGELAQWWEGQLSDGWGESLEQHEIMVDRGDLYVEPWTSGEDFFIDTQREFNQRLGLTPAQAALSEPDMFDSGEAAALRETLIDRLNDNLSDYFTTLRGKYNEEITGMSSEIGAWMDAHYYLTEQHNFHTSELEYLLKFENPLEVVADQFLVSGPDDRSDIMWEIFDRQEALQGDYALVPAAPDDKALKRELFARLDKNLSDYCEGLMTVDKREIIGMAEEIATWYAARDYLKTAYDFKTGEVEYLLQFQDPLAVVANHWPGTSDGLVPMDGVVADILGDRDSHGHYVRVLDADAPPSKESARSGTDREKPSVLEQIREAARAPKEPHREKPVRDKSGPEL